MGEETCTKEKNTLIGDKSHLDTDAFTRYDKDMKIEPDAADPEYHDQMSLMYVILNFWAWFTHRKVYRMKLDKPMIGEPILVLDSVFERIKNWKLEDSKGNKLPLSYKTTKYRPPALVGVPYKVVNSNDMTVSEEAYPGVEELPEW